MTGARTPFRMSFIGGGTDLKEFYTQYPGCVLSTSINKYMYVFIHKYFDNRIQVKYSKTELVNKISEIKHPIVRSILNKFGISGIDINSIADIPSGTGLGSSSSYTVSLLNALYSYQKKNISVDILAREACEIEIDILNEPIGKQDQYAAAYGGLNIIRFLKNGDVKVEPLTIEKNVYNELQNNLMLFYTGQTRSASLVLKDQKNSFLNEKSKFDLMIQMTDLVESAKNYLVQSDLRSFGNTLDLNWNLKRSLSSKISNNNIDDIYGLAKKNGAIGGKLLGAGGSGFMLFYCEKENQNRLRRSLKRLREFDFQFDNIGSKIIYND